MKRILNILPNNKLEFDINVVDSNSTWYFVNWDNDLKDDEGNYIIYTNRKTFGKKVEIFKSKDWTIICRIGNMINGIFQNYFGISERYQIESVLNIDNLIKNIKQTDEEEKAPK